MHPEPGIRHGLLRWLLIASASTAAAGLLAFSPARAQEIEPRQRSESPYFFVRGGDPSVDRLPLKDTRVDVRISGVIADVTVTQHYRNEGQRPIEPAMCSPARRVRRSTA